MTHRVDIQKDPEGVTVLFQGLLDGSAFAALVGLCRAQTAAARPVRVLLRAGTQVEADLLEALAATPGVSLEAESPFLARWLERCRRETPNPHKEQP